MDKQTNKLMQIDAVLEEETNTEICVRKLELLFTLQLLEHCDYVQDDSDRLHMHLFLTHQAHLLLKINSNKCCYMCTSFYKS